MTVFGYAGEVLERFPATTGGVIHATGLSNGLATDPLLTAYRAEQVSVKDRIGTESLADIDSIAAWRRTFSGFGVKPTQYRNAAEALLRRLTKAGDIPSINLLVDMANLVSIRYAMPVAVFDQKDVTGRTTVAFAEGTERFTDLGTKDVTHPEIGEVIFVDDAALVSARRWCWRQSSQSAAGPSTTEAVITVEGQHDTARDDVPRALADLAELLGEHQTGATLESWVLDRGQG